MTQTLTIAKAKQDLAQLVANTKKKNKYVITLNGAPTAMLVSKDDYESMQETLEIMSDKKLMRDLRQAEKEIKEGKGEDWEDVKKELGLK